MLLRRRPIPDMRPDHDAIMEKVRLNSKPLETGCWEWTAFRNWLGYGNTSWRNRPWAVTRLVYAATHGAFDPKLHVCHRCDKPWCVNPEHLWLGTNEENMEDCARKRRLPQQSRTHCPHGHEYNEVNTYIIPNGPKKGGRACKACSRMRQRIKAGWTKEQATTLSVTPFGYRPVNGNYKRRGSQANAGES